MNWSDLYFEHVFKACNTHLLSTDKICLAYFSIDTVVLDFSPKSVLITYFVFLACEASWACSSSSRHCSWSSWVLSPWSLVQLWHPPPGVKSCKKQSIWRSATWHGWKKKDKIIIIKKYEDGCDLHDSSSSWNHGATSSTSSPATHRHCKCLQHGLLTAFTKINGGCKHRETREWGYTGTLDQALLTYKLAH